MLLGRSVAEFSSKKEAKVCYLSQKSIQKFATVGILWQAIYTEKLNRLVQWHKVRQGGILQKCFLP
jgi:hypothetical protein